MCIVARGYILFSNPTMATQCKAHISNERSDLDVDSDSVDGFTSLNSNGLTDTNNEPDIYSPCLPHDSPPIVKPKSYPSETVKNKHKTSALGGTFFEQSSKSARAFERQRRDANDTVDSPDSPKDPEINHNAELKHPSLFSDDQPESLQIELSGFVCEVRPRVKKQSSNLGSDGSVKPKTTSTATRVSKSSSTNTTFPNGSRFEGSRTAGPVSLDIPQHQQRNHLGFTPASRPASGYQQLSKPSGLQSNQHVKQYEIESRNFDLQPKVHVTLNDDQTEKRLDGQSTTTAAGNSRSYLADSGYDSMTETQIRQYTNHLSGPMSLFVQPNTAHVPTLTQQGHVKQGLNGGVASATHENTAATHVNTSTTYNNNTSNKGQPQRPNRTPKAGQTENQTLPLKVHATTSHVGPTPSNKPGLKNPPTGNLNDAVSLTSKQHEKTITSIQNDKTTRVASPTSKQLEAANRSIENDKIINLLSTKLTPRKKHHTDDPLWPEYERLFRQQRCNICWVSHAEILNLPCRHLNACDVCSDPQEFCTSCSQEIIGVVKVFFG